MIAMSINHSRDRIVLLAVRVAQNGLVLPIFYLHHPLDGYFILGASENYSPIATFTNWERALVAQGPSSCMR